MARHFTHWLKEYCSYTAVSEAPLDFHFWTGVSTIAGTVTRRVWRDENLFKWTPNFYIVFVGPAGIATKSTTMSLGYDLLKMVPGVSFGPDSMTWHGLAKKFEGAFAYHSKLVTDPMDKKIGFSALTCSISELGTFLRPEDHSLISFLTDVWDGKERPFEHSTGYSGQIKIENPWLNIIGATTPEWMRDNFPASMLQQGIGSRIIFVYGDRKRHLTAYPSQAQKLLPTNYIETGQKLLEDLKAMQKLFGPFELTQDAYSWGTDWYARHNAGREKNLASNRYSGYLARKQTHLHKLAMILSISQRDDLLIDDGDLQAAEVLLGDIERSMIRVFESVGFHEEAKFIAEVVQYVRTYGFLTLVELYRLCFNVMSEKDFKIACRVAVEGQLLEVTSQGGKNGLRPRKQAVN